VLGTEISVVLPEGTALLRNTPSQTRSSRRLVSLLDATAMVVDEVGFERVTTAMVAERSGASIGTVYRYFPDRIVILEALALRSAQRLAERFITALERGGATSWQDACDALIDVTAEMYRTEPGFRVIRFGGAAGLGTGDDDRMAALSGVVSAVMQERFGMPGNASTAAWVMLIESGHAVLDRAHRRRTHPDPALIDTYRAMVRSYLASIIAD
jgi:AcrR family transcriptional regulator